MFKNKKIGKEKQYSPDAGLLVMLEDCWAYSFEEEGLSFFIQHVLKNKKNKK